MVADCPVATSRLGAERHQRTTLRVLLPIYASTSRQGSRHRPRRSAAAADRSVHGAVPPLRIGGLTRQPERALDGTCETRRPTSPADQRVAVGAPREGVAL